MNDVAPAERVSPLLAIGTAGMLAAAVARAVVAMPPWKWFDVDPLRSPGALEGLAPSASLGLDALLLLSASLLLVGVVRSGRRIDALSLLLALLPIPVLAWHASQELEQAWRGTTLAASWVGLVAAAHLHAFPHLRTILFGGLVACAVPWLARGGEQWFFEHPAAVAQFQANRDEVLASFGWAEGGEPARLYERRLLQREMSGWFGLANVWAAAIAACAIAWTRIAGATRGGDFGGGSVLVAIVLALACLAGVAMNGSKGGIAALAAGFAFLFLAPRALAWFGGRSDVAPTPPRRSEATRGVEPEGAFEVGERGSRLGSTPPRRSEATRGRCRAKRGGGDVQLSEGLLAGLTLLPRLALLAIPLGLLAIVLRGALPEGLLGEKSLLFRWHYLQGAWWTLLQQPLGIGPAAFQEWYLLVKTPRSPESVQSAHSMLVDAFVAVGVLAAAWIAVLLRVLWRRGIGVEHASPRPRVALACFVVAAIIALAAMVASGAETPSLESIARWVAIGLFVPAAVVAASVLASMSTVAIASLLAAIAFTLLLQGQIEMTYFNQGSIVWAMLMVGLAGSAGVRIEGDSPPARGAVALAILPAVLAIAVVLGPWRGAASAEARLAEAAAPLDAIGRRAASRRERVDPAEILVEIMEARRTAAARLAAIADAGGPAASHAGSLAIEQWLAAGLASADETTRRAAIETALAIADRQLAVHGSSARRSSDRLRAVRALREVDREAVPPQRLAEAILATLAMQPQDVSLHLDLGDAFAEAGDRDAAQQAWRRALELDAALELDPLVQMPESERRAIETRIESGS